MQTRTIIRRSAAGAPVAPARPPENKRYTAVLRIASLVILLVFMAGGLLSGYLFYETVRMVVASVRRSRNRLRHRRTSSHISNQPGHVPSG